MDDPGKREIHQAPTAPAALAAAAHHTDEQWLASVIASAMDAIITVDIEQRIVLFNAAAEQMFRCPASEALGQPMERFIPPRYRAVHQAHFRTFEATGTTSRSMGALSDLSAVRADGEEFPIEASISQAIAGGQHLFTVIVRDVTARHQAEEALRLALHEKELAQTQLQQTQRLESVGRLAGGIAHDFNNLLMVIHVYSDLMRAELAPDSPLVGRLDQIRRASERAAALTRQLLAFSRKQILTPTDLDLNQLVTNLLKMLERLIGEDVALAMVLQPGLWSVTADAGQIEQVIMNLVVNARDAMPTGGQLTIETHNVHFDASYARMRVEAPTGPCVMLAVSDTGHGMDEPTQARIFEPFFTTKEPGQGTGLGLATVHGIVKQSGGDILVYSEPGQGTTFKVILPATGVVAEGSSAPATRVMAGGGHETILLVEDEDMVRSLVREVLIDLGYTVLVAPGGYEALALVNQYDGQIALLLTDVVMPKMGGPELAERLRTIRPHTRVLFMSGYTDDAVIRHGLLTAEAAFLAKPFSPNSLAAKIRELLNA